MAVASRPVTFRGTSGDRRPAAAALAALGYVAARATPLELVVLDSFDGLLADAGLTLVCERGTVLRLGGMGVVPVELSIAAPPVRASDLPPGPVRERLAALLDVRALIVHATVSAVSAELTRRDESGATVGRARSIERIAVTPGPFATVGTAPATSAPLLVELDPVTGYPSAHRRGVAAMSDLGLTQVDRPWLDVVLRDAGVMVEGYRHSPTIPLDPTAPIITSTRTVLAHLASAAEANWRPTVEDIDPEFLHDLRVALRRTRSVLRETKTVLPAAIGATARERFRAIAGATGDGRDLDVYLIEWPGYTAALSAETVTALEPARQLLIEHRGKAYDRLRAVLLDPGSRQWMDRWQAWLSAPVTDADQGPDQHASTGRFARRRITRAHRRLVRDGRRITVDTPAEQLHELRKDAKRLRYLVECFGGTLDATARAPFVKRLKVLQENLGEHQDAEVHVAHLHELSLALHARRAPASTLVALGQLSEQLDRRRRAARREFARRFADFDTRATRRDLAAMLGADP